MSEPIKMPFGMLSQVDPRNHILDGVQIPCGRGRFWEGRACHYMLNDTGVSCAKMAEPIDMPFG